MLFTSIYRKKINAAEALIPLVAFNFKTYLKKMPHAKSAKSTTTTVLYGIFSSENFYPCTVICNAHQYEIACRREHLCQAYGCAKTYLEHDFPRYKTHSTIRNPGFCCPVITPISVKITSQNLNILEKGMDET